ncbi:heme ABC transporter ATP-binding protein [Labrenzia aggregata]|uniref:Heme ABC transporter ATP-binding protein n=2 Tax=Roseibium aggregatum TaxID=187304 RepID=A0A926P072_9HYPH|nr:heme ABC transporter ATP-binding protein [Roseibium aggregatum]
MAMETNLSVTGLAVRLTGKTIVSDVTFAAHAGKVCTIVGPNGSGKSTLLKAITGETGHDGEVRLNARPLGRYPPRELAEVRAVLPQHTQLSFPLTVKEVVRLGLQNTPLPLAEAQGRIGEALDRVDMAGFEGRAYQSLSGGEQQRVQLARVLCQVWQPKAGDQPRWLILDEPISSLDIRHQLLIMDVARDFADRGGGVLCVLHDLNLTAMYADQVLVMKNGRLLADGPVADVYRDDLISDAFDFPLKIGSLPVADVPFLLPQAAEGRLPAR